LSRSPRPSSSLRNFVSRFSQTSVSFRWNAPTRRSGWLRHTSRLRTLCTTGCTYRRTRLSSLIATKSITTKRNTQTRKPSLHRRLRSFDADSKERFFQPPINRSSFNPDRYLGDTLTCAESSKLSNAMDRDHWAFGAGYVQKTCCSFFFSSTSVDIPSDSMFCATVAASVRVSTSQNGSSGSRSHGCSGRTTFDRFLTNPYLWRNMRASPDAPRCRIASPSHPDTTECRRCLRRRRKSP
jgi:hypothetical protein